MKKILNILWMLLAAFLFSSCLKSGLEDLPEYGDADILSVSKVEYRYISEEIAPSSGQQLVKNATLSHKAEVDKEAGTVSITVTVPGSFPQGELASLSAKELVLSLNLSSAARITPLNGSAALGVPADWSKTNSYSVMAADGTKKNWEITLTLEK